MHSCIYDTRRTITAICCQSLDTLQQFAESVNPVGKAKGIRSIVC